MATDEILDSYVNLGPDQILNAIESAGYDCDGRIFALNSYENRVYQIGIHDAEPVVAKFYRPARWADDQILEEHQFTQELAQHEIPAIAPIANPAGDTLHLYDQFRFALYPRNGGRPPELDNPEQLLQLGRFIGRIHSIGASKSFAYRQELSIQAMGLDSFHFLMANKFIPLELEQSYQTLCEDIIKRIQNCFERAGNIRNIRLHGDCHAGNVLWNIHGPQIVDLDDCLMGPAIQDIWMLLSGDTEQERSLQLTRILQGYQEFHDFDFREIHLIEALRTLRMIHYSAWLAKRWEDPAFPASFPWFNTQPYWREQLENLQEQILLVDQAKEDINLFSTDE